MSKRVVAIYLVDRAYGGPEEGGWWYDCGERFSGFAPIVCEGRLAVRKALAKCRVFIRQHRMNEGRHEPNSVLCDGWYLPQSFGGEVAPHHFPQARPTYA